MNTLRYCLTSLLTFIVFGWGGAGVAAQTSFPYTPLQNALDNLVKGEILEASKQAQSALELQPDHGLVQNLVGAIWLYAGEPRKARVAFESALQNSADRSLALYGLGLSYLAEDDFGKAQANFEFAKESALNPEGVELAQNYARWLFGSSPVTQRLKEGDTNVLMPLAALKGMEQRANRKTAEARLSLEMALNAPANTLLRQSWGVLMTFDKQQPLTTGYPILPSSVRMEMPQNSVEVYRGNEKQDGTTVYVNYEVDGQPVGLVNSFPYTVIWNSRAVPNGLHELKITQMNANGVELKKTLKRIRVLNPEGEPRSEEERDRQVKLRTRLATLLTLQPDRCVCAYTLGEIALQSGERARAQGWFWRAAAIRPAFRDVRQKLLACGGVEVSGEPVYGGLPTEKLVALTFDDGPKPGMTEPLLEMLADAKAPSTFFVIGRHVTANPNLTKRIVDMGMEIANHSYTHRNLTKLTPTDLEREIVETQAAAFLATGKIPHFLRPPGGNWSDAVAAAVQKWGITSGFWTVDVYGAEVINAQEVAKKTLESRLQSAKQSERDALRAQNTKKRRIAE
ncbi:MAG: polysaccharide deacetylase family protein [Armatimonadetes bacterium]|nr:polysaccharide deacetylase family protein [Armatimonadota bacterium]